MGVALGVYMWCHHQRCVHVGVASGVSCGVTTRGVYMWVSLYMWISLPEVQKCVNVGIIITSVDMWVHLIQCFVPNIL